MNMSASQRMKTILDLLRAGNPVSVKELSNSLCVSSMTIRRDLNALEKDGLLLRSHGWAEPAHTTEYEPSYVVRSKENQSEKHSICLAANELVKDGDVIMLDVGTTLLDLCGLLSQKSGITVLTHWLPHAIELAKHPNIKTIITGGRLRYSELSLVGPIAEKTLSEFNVSICFINVGGVSIDKGLTDYNIDEVEIKKRMMASAAKSVVVADFSKLGRVAPIKIAPFDKVDILITDDKAPANIVERIQANGLSTIIAG